MAATEPQHPSGTIDPDEFRVSTTDEKHEVRSFGRSISKLDGSQMTFKVMHTDERSPMQSRKAAAGHRSHHERSRQPRGHRGRNGIEITNGDTGLCQHCLHQHR